MATFRQNLVRARSHIVMVLALACGLALVFWLEGLELRKALPEDPLLGLTAVEPLPLAQPRPLTDEERTAATIAWRYFENNIDPDTGLLGSVDGYPSTTMWEMGTFFVAVTAAERLDLITKDQAMARFTLALDSLSKIRLLEEGLPNKAYDIRTLELVDYQNKPSERGLGWSTLDIGRLLSGLSIAEHAHPELAPRITSLLSGWNLKRAHKLGELNGANITDGVLSEHQEGRIGYEQYAAKAFLAFGVDTTRALDVTGHLAVYDVGGVMVPVDARLNRGFSPAMTTSEPYVLDGIEFGFDWRSQIFASQVYRAQEKRYADTGKLTAVSEGHINVPPYFAYASVWGGGQPWAVMSFSGERIDSRRTLSTKAAFGWDALFATPYTARLVAAVSDLNEPDRGWQEGRYEIDGAVNTSITANTNGIILTALAVRAGGPMLQIGK
ncbi:DUF3131 domain-containing protein [Neotabrizicola sp. VNH66]|uniref:DUF3131 domain-containing protein n=1 Tax=Neotabrizicola sp. VNH66 TaxID=3400918 RepID=UPI003C0222EE